MSQPIGRVPLEDAWPILESVIIHQRDSLQLAELALASGALTPTERARVQSYQRVIAKAVVTTLEDVMRILDAGG